MTAKFHDRKVNLVPITVDVIKSMKNMLNNRNINFCGQKNETEANSLCNVSENSLSMRRPY